MRVHSEKYNPGEAGCLLQIVQTFLYINTIPEERAGITMNFSSFPGSGKNGSL
jgi:hypothetical protein